MKAIPLDSNATKRHVYLDIARVFAILSITCYHAFSRSFALGVNHLPAKAIIPHQGVTPNIRGFSQIYTV